MPRSHVRSGKPLLRCVALRPPFRRGLLRPPNPRSAIHRPLGRLPKSFIRITVRTDQTADVYAWVAWTAAAKVFTLLNGHVLFRPSNKLCRAVYARSQGNVDQCRLSPEADRPKQEPIIGPRIVAMTSVPLSQAKTYLAKLAAGSRNLAKRWSLPDLGVPWRWCFLGRNTKGCSRRWRF